MKDLFSGMISAGFRFGFFPFVSLAFLHWISTAAFAGPPAPCNPRFLERANQVVSGLAKHCKPMEVMEPSSCQRALFDRCTRSFQEAKSVRLQVCQNLMNEGEYLESRGYGSIPPSQRVAQEASAELNREAQTVSESMVTLLKLEKEKVKAVLQENQKVMESASCRKSSFNRQYRRAMLPIQKELETFVSLLGEFKERKRGDSLAARQTSAEGARRAESLSSLNPLIEPEPKKGPSAAALPAAAIGGIAGAGLIMAASDRGYEPPLGGISPASPVADGGPGGNMDRYRGDADKFLEENGIFVDASFRDREKAQIAQAVQYIPPCHREKLRGMKIVNNPNLRWRKAAYAGRCLPGINTSFKRVELNPTCYQEGISTGLVVHEMIHVIAGPHGMYTQYAPTYHRYPGCPVSEYARMNFNLHEDFTEAARLSVYPSSGGQLQNQCANAKIAAAKEIFALCR